LHLYPFKIATFLVPKDTRSILSNRMPRIKGKNFSKKGEMWQKIYNWGLDPLKKSSETPGI